MWNQTSSRHAGQRSARDASAGGDVAQAQAVGDQVPGKPFEGTAKAGQKVHIEWSGRWWPGKIVKLGRGRFHISDDGSSAAWNEAVGADRLRLRA